MAEIKSFREYIEEKGVIEEAYKRTRNGKSIADALKTGRERMQAQAAEPEEASAASAAQAAEPEVASAASSAKAAEPEVASAASSAQAAELPDNVDKIDISTPIDLKIDYSLPPDEIRKKLRVQCDKIKNTFNNLERLLTAEGFNKAKDKPGLPMNVIGDTSLAMVKTDFDKDWNDHIEKYRQTKENAKRTKTLMSKRSSQEEKDKSFEELKDKDNVGYRQKSLNKVTEEPVKEESAEASVALNEASINILEKKKAFLDSLRAIPKVFKTTSELSSGTRNKYSADNILTTTERKYDGVIGRHLKKDDEKTSVYGIGGENDTQFSDKMYNRFLNDARSIIYKERPLGLSYLNRAEKKLEKYENSAKYIKVSDESYASEIFKDLYRAFSVLTYIGANIKTLIKEYQKSINKIKEEIKIKDAKNVKFLDSTNAQKALDNQEERIRRREQTAHNVADTVTNNGEHIETEKIQKEKEKESAKIKKEEVNDYDEIKGLAAKEFKKLSKYGETEEFNNKRIADECNKLLASIEGISSSTRDQKKLKKLSNSGWEVEKDENGMLLPISNLVNQKKAKAIALYVFLDKLDKLKAYSQSSDFRKYANSNFERWFTRAMRKLDKVSAESILRKVLQRVGGTLPNDAKQKPASADENAETSAAKDFNGEEPEKSTNQPTNIYAYALQKAKDNK